MSNKNPHNDKYILRAAKDLCKPVSTVTSSERYRAKKTMRDEEEAAFQKKMAEARKKTSGGRTSIAAMLYEAYKSLGGESSLEQLSGKQVKG